MIKEEENEKDYKFFKVILLLFESFIIGICVIFFVGVSKVNALDNRSKNRANDSWSIWTDDQIDTDWNFYNVDYTTSSRSWLQLRDKSIITESGKKYNLEFKVGFRYYKQSSSQVAPGFTLEIYNDSNLVDMGFLCTTSITQGSVVLYASYMYDVKCVNFSGSGYYPYISFQIHSNEVQSKDVRVHVYSWNYYENTSGVDTNSIINNQNQNTETITDNANQNAENIINNQNQNTEKEIESQKVCTYIDKNNIKTQSKYLNTSGQELNNQNYGITDYIKIENSTVEILESYTFNYNYFGLCYYKDDKTLISCTPIMNLSGELTIPTNAVYMRSTIYVGNLPTFKICTNGNQALNDSVDDINDTLNDSSVDDPSGQLGDMENYFGTNGVISDLLLLPVRMFQSIVNTIDGTCSDFSLGRLLGHDLIMPCINLSSRLGNSLYNVIDILISGFFILAIRKKFVDIFEHFTSLKTGGNELE